MVFGQGFGVVTYSATHVERGKRPQADTTQPGVYGVDQTPICQVFKAIGYEPILFFT
jgi:hypothetical protein